MMKKHILAVSIAAALGAMAGTASAAPTLKANGIGHVNVIPYFSTQGDNVTQISVTNTDTANAKAVKIRFRGAEWSDDIFDFTVFLSPGDVFTGAVTANASGVSSFSTSDGSCTLPANVNQDFPTIRLDNPTTGTREGYVEVINMADIQPGSTLFTAIKHVNGVAPCKTAGSASATLLNNLGQDNMLVSAPVAGQVMSNPTTGLTSWNRVIDVVNVKAYGVPATAYDFATTRKAYFRQANEEITVAGVAAVDTDLTSDRIFFEQGVATAAGTAAGSQISKMYQFDMPDLSTRIDASTAASAAAMRNEVAAILAKDAVVTEYSTLAAVSGATDVVLTQPVRRYHYNYATNVAGTAFSRTINGAEYDITGDAGTAYAGLELDNRIPLKDLSAAYVPAGYSGPALFFDREEQYNALATDIVISPTPPGASYDLSLKGEASVIGFNRGGATVTGALGASLTMNDITIQGGYETGWMMLSTVADIGAGVQLPVIGFSAINVAGGNNYGTTLPLRYYGAAGAISH